MLPSVDARLLRVRQRSHPGVGYGWQQDRDDVLLSGIGEGELVQFIVLLFTALMASSFFAPVVVGLFWRRANATGAAAAMLGGCVTTFVWKLYGPGTTDPVLPGCAVSALLFVAGSMLSSPPRRETAS